VDGCIRRQRAGRGQGVQHEASHLVDRDVVSKLAGLDAGDEQVPDEFLQVLLRVGDVVGAMKRRRELTGGLLADHHGVSGENGLRADARTEGGSVSELPSHPDAGNEPAARPAPKGSRARTALWVTLVVAVLIAVVVLHVTGVLGAEAHS
jgi:hypothetical protein